MIKQLSNGQVINIDDIDSVREMFDTNQLEIVEAMLERMNDEIHTRDDELEEVLNLLEENDNNIRKLKQYIKRW